MKEEKPAKLRRFFSKKKIIAGIIVLLILGVIFVPKLFSKTPVDVKTAKVERGTVDSELVISGVVKADEDAQLSFQSSGELSFLGVQEGDKVKKGKLLARLDINNLNAAYESALADYRNSQANLALIYDQVQGHTTDESFAQRATRTTAESASDKAYRALTIAKTNLDNGGLVAPFDGVITRIINNTGVNTIFSQPQVEIVNLDSLYFEVTADQNDVTKISNGQKVNIVLDSYPNDTYKGEVFFISYTPESDQAGTVYRVKVKLDKDFDITKVRVGMTGDAKLVLSEKENVLFVAPQFVKADTKGSYVKKGSENDKTYITSGIVGTDREEISGNVKEGDILFN